MGTFWRKNGKKCTSSKYIKEPPSSSQSDPIIISPFSSLTFYIKNEAQIHTGKEINLPAGKAHEKRNENEKICHHF